MSRLEESAATVTHIARTRSPSSCSPFALPVLGSAALGFAFGVLYPATQVAIEPAQVLAGLVAYPPGNAFWLYETRVWTVLHQILAPLLAVGIQERQLSQLLSGCAGALNFAALAAFGRALGAAPAAAAVAPFLFWALDPVSWGWGYPILVIGHPHTYGTFGLAWAVLACSMLGAGRFAAGAALLGFAPALHPTVGAFTMATTGIAGLLGRHSLAPHRAELMRGGALGVGLAALSLGLHWVAQPTAPAPDPAAIERLYPVFLREWEAHRQPFDVTARHVWMLGLEASIALVWMRRDLAAAPALLVRTLLVTIGLGVVFALINRYAPLESLPRPVQAAMALRILNFAVIVFIPLLAATLTQAHASGIALVAASMLAAIALLWHRVQGIETWGIAVVGVIALAEAARGRAAPRDAARAPQGARPFEVLVAVAVAAGITHALVLSVRSYPRRAAAVLRDRTNDPALAAASRTGELLVVAPGVERAQLATRRPVVIDPQALDMVAYVPAALPAVARAIEDLYGIDFEAPPAGDRNLSVVPVSTVRKIWEQRSPAEWSAVSREFGVHEILTPAGWRLQLPEVARSSVYVLRRVPADRDDSATP